MAKKYFDGITKINNAVLDSLIIKELPNLTFDSCFNTSSDFNNYPQEGKQTVEIVSNIRYFADKIILPLSRRFPYLKDFPITSDSLSRIKINSWYRSQAVNDDITKKHDSRSNHIFGMAMDFQLLGKNTALNTSRHFDIFKYVYQNLEFDEGELYPNWEQGKGNEYTGLHFAIKRKGNRKYVFYKTDPKLIKADRSNKTTPFVFSESDFTGVSNTTNHNLLLFGNAAIPTNHRNFLFYMFQTYSKLKITDKQTAVEKYNSYKALQTYYTVLDCIRVGNGGFDNINTKNDEKILEMGFFRYFGENLNLFLEKSGDAVMISDFKKFISDDGGETFIEGLARGYRNSKPFLNVNWISKISRPENVKKQLEVFINAFDSVFSAFGYLYEDGYVSKGNLNKPNDVLEEPFCFALIIETLIEKDVVLDIGFYDKVKSNLGSWWSSLKESGSKISKVILKKTIDLAVETSRDEITELVNKLTNFIPASVFSEEDEKKLVDDILAKIKEDIYNEITKEEEVPEEETEDDDLFDDVRDKIREKIKEKVREVIRQKIKEKIGADYFAEIEKNVERMKELTDKIAEIYSEVDKFLDDQADSQQNTIPSNFFENFGGFLPIKNLVKYGINNDGLWLSYYIDHETTIVPTRVRVKYSEFMEKYFTLNKL